LNSTKLAPTKIRPSRPRSKVIWVGPVVKFSWVCPDQNSSKFDLVGFNDTSFRKFNLNFFYKKWISDFELNPNIWIWILKKSKLILWKKYIWIKNQIQLFRCKIDVDWIIQNSIHFYLLYRGYILFSCIFVFFLLCIRVRATQVFYN